MYQVVNLPILHSALQNIFHYSVKCEYLALSSDGDYATIPSECDMLTCIFTRGHICQFSMTFYATENVSLYLYTLFVNDAE